MQKIAFYIVYPFIKLFSYLPLSVLYFLSDFKLYPLLYYVVGYRRKVVQQNLSRVFPNKTDKERNTIEKKFYHFLSDLFVETIKGFSISYKTLNNRITYNNYDELLHAFNQNKGVVVTVGHIGNYEWMAQHFSRFSGLTLAVPYRRLTNKYFDKAFKKSREKGGAILFHTKETKDFLANNKEKVCVALANDQSAPPNFSFWVRFLNQDTCFYEGTETIAKEYNFPVFFAKIEIPSRGHYAITFIPITKHPRNEETGFILNEHARLLEQNILEYPEYWLWTHRRWKHQKPKGFDYGFSRGFQPN